MARASALVAVTLALINVACARLPDAEILNATLYDFYSRGPGVGSFPPGSIFLVHPMSQTWNVEDSYVPQASDPDSDCQFNAEIYQRIAARNSAPVNLSTVIAPRAHWRVATDRELATTENEIPPYRLGDDFVFSFGSLSMPAYSDDHNTAYVRLSFNWGLHGGYGEYILFKDRGGWLVQCRVFQSFP
jgi:hypothetical protein